MRISEWSANVGFLYGAQTFDKQDPRALHSASLVFSDAGVAATVSTLQTRDFQEGHVFIERDFVFVVSLDLVLIFVPLYRDGQGARNQTLQVSEGPFDTFGLLQFSCERWWNDLIWRTRINTVRRESLHLHKLMKCLYFYSMALIFVVLDIVATIYSIYLLKPGDFVTASGPGLSQGPG